MIEHKYYHKESSQVVARKDLVLSKHINTLQLAISCHKMEIHPFSISEMIILHTIPHGKNPFIIAEIT